VPRELKDHQELEEQQDSMAKKVIRETKERLDDQDHQEQQDSQDQQV